ncbi:LA2681 family HEPN domain-containing protein [Terricaulis sp.]|uniref:LA2681 family HEPN domain-containing protein n=1 Tax=Terricaulis sp. TaxID=2768686 RepID=UPI002AC427E8|nr:LA2681 family HEPN domain-containing protein [Terricaulis sp.]MDZ4693409.1 LA2681 family HEPN domain-containing protein [Terricaulis sp.]
MTNTAAAFEQLMKIDDLRALGHDQALSSIAQLVDLAADFKRIDGEDKALRWCDELEETAPKSAALLHYFRANVWGNRRARKYKGPWDWEQPELQHELLWLRKSIRDTGFDDLEDQRRCQILTNLGNELNTVGRFVEAQEYWRRALDIRPTFAMARGNSGYGLTEYARALYDLGHQGVFLQEADRLLSSALDDDAEYDGDNANDASAYFSRVRESIAPFIENLPAIDLDAHSMGSNHDERLYRQWCLENKLFLNPLNDLGARSIAANDILLLPSFTTSIDEPPTLIGFFNQMKQEFASARWMLYDGTHQVGVHFSDREVALYNTLDYPAYSLAVEKAKIAYRVGYSILDKIAYFLNAYLALGIKPTAVYFRTVWYHGDAKKRTLRPEFTASENWPLRGLYWLAKDVFDESLRDVTEPDAAALYAIRNHLEHSHLKIHEMMLPPLSDITRPDTFTYSVERGEFERKALRVLKLTRAALTYLSLAMHREEERRSQSKSSGTGVFLPLTLIEDEWKT